VRRRSAQTVDIPVVLPLTGGAAFLGHGERTALQIAEKLVNAEGGINTAGLLTFLEGASLVGWGSQSYTLDAFTGERPLHIGGLLVPPQGLWLLGIALAINRGVAFTLARTRIGRAFQACAENPWPAPTSTSPATPLRRCSGPQRPGARKPVSAPAPTPSSPSSACTTSPAARQRPADGRPETARDRPRPHGPAPPPAPRRARRRP